MPAREPDDTRTALLDSARRLLADEGASALTVRRIATDVGLSTMNVYSRFGGKEGIIDELYREGFIELFGILGEIPRTNDVSANLRAFTSAYRQYAIEHRHSYDLMFRSAVPEFVPSAESRRTALSLLEGLVSRIRVAQSDGLMAPTPPPSQIAVWVWATCHGMLSLEFDDVGSEVVDWPLTWDAAVENMASILLAERDTLAT